jgi:hypothetical protein
MCLVVFFLEQQDQQQQQQQAEGEVLVPHQELPNGAQPMEGSAHSCLLASS